MKQINKACNFFKSNMSLQIAVLFLLKFNEQRNVICRPNASKLVVQKNLLKHRCVHFFDGIETSSLIVEIII